MFSISMSEYYLRYGLENFVSECFISLKIMFSISMSEYYLRYGIENFVSEWRGTVPVKIQVLVFAL